MRALLACLKRAAASADAKKKVFLLSEAAIKVYKTSLLGRSAYVIRRPRSLINQTSSVPIAFRQRPGSFFQRKEIEPYPSLLVFRQFGNPEFQRIEFDTRSRSRNA